MFLHLFLTSLAGAGEEADALIRRRNGGTEAGRLFKTRPGLDV